MSRRNNYQNNDQDDDNDEDFSSDNNDSPSSDEEQPPQNNNNNATNVGFEPNYYITNKPTSAINSEDSWRVSGRYPSAPTPHPTSNF